MFAFIIEYFYVQVGKNKIEVLTWDEQNGMSHDPVQIILTNQDNFSDEESSLWEVIRETSDRQWRNTPGILHSKSVISPVFKYSGCSTKSI